MAQARATRGRPRRGEHGPSGADVSGLARVTPVRPRRTCGPGGAGGDATFAKSPLSLLEINYTLICKPMSLAFLQNEADKELHLRFLTFFPSSKQSTSRGRWLRPIPAGGTAPRRHRSSRGLGRARGRRRHGPRRPTPRWPRTHTGGHGATAVEVKWRGNTGPGVLARTTVGE